MHGEQCLQQNGTTIVIHQTVDPIYVCPDITVSYYDRHALYLGVLQRGRKAPICKQQQQSAIEQQSATEHESATEQFDALVASVLNDQLPCSSSNS